MKILIVGASGATGKYLVKELLSKGEHVKIIIRETSNIPEYWNVNDKISIIKANITDISVKEISEYIKDCKAIVSCLGHKLTWKGIYGKPQKLVTETIIKLCNAIKIQKAENKIKLVLMNTAGNRNRDINEPITFSEKIVTGFLRVFLPPHPDNEKAADFLRINIGKDNPLIDWVTVRPDSLISEDKITDYSLHVSPTRSAFFNAGKTSRINVAHFIASLIADDNLWNKWKGQMPVIYNLPYLTKNE